MAEQDYLVAKAFRMPKLRKPKAPASFAAGDPFAAATMPSSLAKPVKRRVRPASGPVSRDAAALTQMERVKIGRESDRVKSLIRAGGTPNKPANPFDMIKSDEGVEKGLPSVLRGPGRAATMERLTDKSLSQQFKYARAMAYANNGGKRAPFTRARFGLRALDGKNPYPMDVKRVRRVRAELQAGVPQGKLGVESGAKERMEGYRQARLDRIGYKKPANRVLP